MLQKRLPMKLKHPIYKTPVRPNNGVRTQDLDNEETKGKAPMYERNEIVAMSAQCKPKRTQSLLGDKRDSDCHN